MNPVGVLLDVSIGMPQVIEMNGKNETTAFLKKPVEGSAYIHENGAEGDKPAWHSESVYAYPKEHYNFWGKELDVDPDTWEHGHFGENLTIQGFDETEMHLGDVLQIGEEVKLEVVASRYPCFKLAWRMKQPLDFIKRFSSSGKTGWYLKVLQEGRVQRGDHIMRIKNNPTALSIAELALFLANINEASEEELYRVVSMDSLGMTSRSMINRRIATVRDIALTKQGRWSGWRKFIIEKIVDEALDIKSFWMRPQDGQSIAGYRPGQFLTCRVPPKIRTWTISEFDPVHNSYRVTIKKVPQGVVSAEMIDHYKVGSEIEVKPPNGSFVLDRGNLKPIVLISAGIGITPMVAMLKAHIQGLFKPLPFLYFVHGARDGKSHPFKNEIKETIKGVENIKTLQYYSQPTDEDTEYDVKGRFNINDLDKLMDGVKLHFGKQWYDWPKQNCLFYLCGPKDFQETVKEKLSGWGVEDTSIYTESFTPPGGNPIGVKAESSKVIFSKSMKEVMWTDIEDLTLLELAEKNGIDVPNSCRMGSCKTCECKLSKGSIYYEHGDLANLSQEKVLLCSAKPGSEEMIIEL